MRFRRVFHWGTEADDSAVGYDTMANVFSDYGIGADKLVGGNSSDRFVMSVDHKEDWIDGGEGYDYLQYERSDRALTIDLESGKTTALFGNTVETVAKLASIEGVLGSNFDDKIIGSADDNQLYGLDGDDTIRAGKGNDWLAGGRGTNELDGGDGTDTAFFEYGTTASLAAGKAVSHDPATGAVLATDTLISIENLMGSGFDDALTGNDKANGIDGARGNDLIEGGGGGDILHGGEGDDQITGGSFAATATSFSQLFGDTGNDRLFGSAGKDGMDGGADIDWADYSLQAAGGPGVTVDLAAGVGRGGWAEGDTYTGIENVRGSRSDDTITGNRDDNVLVGLDGRDTLRGADGNDVLEGGAGADTLDGGTGINTLSYVRSTAGVSLNLATGTALGGDAAGDTFMNVQNVVGSKFGDLLVGNGGDNVLVDGGGRNVMTGGGGADTFAFVVAEMDGRSRVMDFTIGTDRLAIVGADSLADLSFSQTSTGTIITIDGGRGDIFLSGVDARSLMQHASTDLVFTSDYETLLF